MDLSNILYFAVVLDDESYRRLLKEAEEINLPTDWRPRYICHHMTIAFKTQFNNTELINWCVEHVGEDFSLSVLNLGISEKSMAVMVGTEVPSSNKIKHITLAVNTNTGGKPVDSNFITDWEKFKPMTLRGTITAIPKN